MKAKGIPTSANNSELPLTPATAALAQTNDSSISASTEVTLNAATTIVEVTALDNGIFMKYGTDDVTSANFDEFILANTTRHFVLPDSTTAINFIEETASAHLILIEK